MPSETIKVHGRAVRMSFVGTYEPGDPPPAGYCDWHEWAKVQVRGGLKQNRCGICSLLGFPQELSGNTVSGIDARKRRYVQPVCKKCAAKMEVKDA